MISRLKEFSENFRKLSVFILVLSFILLGSCPLKKAVQSMLEGLVETEHTGLKYTNSFSSVVCLDSERSFINKITLPERQAENIPSISTAILFAAFWSAWRLFKSRSITIRVRDFRSVSLKTVPLYLRNSTFIL